MENNKVFWIKVKNAGTRDNVISNGIVPLMREYSISDYGKVNSFHYSEFFDDKKSFWILVNDASSGFDVVKILCEEFSTPILSYFDGKFYGFNSLGEKIEIPSDYENDYGMVATYIEETTGYNFDSDVYFDEPMDDEFYDDEEFKYEDEQVEEEECSNCCGNCGTDEEELSEIKDMAIEDVENENTFVSHDPDAFTNSTDSKKEEKCNCCNESEDESDNQKKVVEFKEPIVTNDQDLFVEEVEENNCCLVSDDNNESIEFEEITSNFDDEQECCECSCEDKEESFESTELPTASDLNIEFNSVDSYCDAKDDVKTIKLEDEINIDDLSNLLNSLDEEFSEEPWDKDLEEYDLSSILSEEESQDEIIPAEEVVELDSNELDNELEITEEELKDIIKSYEDQEDELEEKQEEPSIDQVSIYTEDDNHNIGLGESSKNGFDSYVVEVDSEDLQDSLFNTEDLEIKVDQQDFEYPNFENMENADLSYLDEQEESKQESLFDINFEETMSNLENDSNSQEEEFKIDFSDIEVKNEDNESEHKIDFSNLVNKEENVDFRIDFEDLASKETNQEEDNMELKIDASQFEHLDSQDEQLEEHKFSFEDLESQAVSQETIFEELSDIKDEVLESETSKEYIENAANDLEDQSCNSLECGVNKESECTCDCEDDALFDDIELDNDLVVEEWDDNCQCDCESTVDSEVLLTEELTEEENSQQSLEDDLYVPLYSSDESIENKSLETEEIVAVEEPIHVVFEDEQETSAIDDIVNSLNQIGETNPEPEISLAEQLVKEEVANEIVNEDDLVIEEIESIIESNDKDDYVQKEVEDSTITLNQAKSKIESEKDLADELKKFLEELNIERKKLAEKKNLIAKRNEEAKKLFAMNYEQERRVKH